MEDRTFRRTTPNYPYSGRSWNSLSVVGWLLAAIFAGYVFPLASAQSTVAVQPLQLGSVLPDVSGQTLSGSPTHLRGVLNEKIAVVVFSFTKGGGEDARVWNERLDHDYSGNQSVACSTVIELQEAPRLLRGIIKSALSREMPTYIRDRVIVTYQDEALWKRRLGVTDPEHAYVLVLGEGGQIRWRSSRAFSDVEFGGLERNVLLQLRNGGYR